MKFLGSAGGAFATATGAGDVATTTTDQGATVPDVFREETGTQNRGIYRIAVLFDPARGRLSVVPREQWIRHRVGVAGWSHLWFVI